jgi:GNAT superfamily N-acetyltransferase
MKLTHRLARKADMPKMRALMQMAIERLQEDFLSPEQIEASKHVMGLDSLLVRDGTYFVIMAGDVMAGCGGWSRRKTLFGGDHTDGRDPELLNPQKDAARVRAMYTHPDYTRRGIGTLILQLCEQAAKQEGFTKVELAATMAGVPLYTHYGFIETERWMEKTPSGVEVPLAKMVKEI